MMNQEGSLKIKFNMTPYVEKRRLPWNSNTVPTVLFILVMFCWEYYAFLFIFLRQLINTYTSLGIFVFVESHFFIIMMMWFYIKCISTGPGYLSPNINESFSNVEEIKTTQEKLIKYKFGKLESADNRGLLNNSNSETRQGDTDIESGARVDDERIRRLGQDPILQLKETGYCFKCNRVKLPRSHHCKQCGKCVVRMDHHCPWVGNCVGLHNHKYFIGFLFYGVIVMLQVFIWEFFYCLLGDKTFMAGLSANDAMQLQINSMTCLALSLAVAFLGGFQLYCASHNITTVEYHLKGIVQRNPFDKKSFMRNLEDIFGTDRSTWLLPTPPKLQSEEELFLLRDY